MAFTYAKGHDVLADPLERHHKRVCGQWREILVVLKRKRRVSHADTESVQDDITSEILARQSERRGFYAQI